MVLKAHVAKNTQKKKSIILSHGNFNYVLQIVHGKNDFAERFKILVGY